MSNLLWQQPYVNVFRHMKQLDWKRVKCQGNVTTIMDKDARGSIWLITGQIPAANFMQIPRSGSLNLVGKHLYVTYKPIVDKYYVFHIDVSTTDNLTVRITLSNMFKFAKTTSTWIQLPIIVDKSSGFETKWTVLCLNLPSMLSTFVHKSYAFVKSLKFCSSVAIKSVATSDYLYEAEKLPRDIGLQPPKGIDWNSIFDYITFPENEKKIKTYTSNKSDVFDKMTFPKESPSKNLVVKELPEINVNILSDDMAKHIHISKPLRERHSDVISENMNDKEGKCLLPDPILRLREVIGLNPNLVTWNFRSNEIIYSSHSVVVALDPEKGKQRFFIGHTGKIACLCTAKGLLISCDSNSLGRCWNLDNEKCIAVFQAPSLRLIDISNDAKIVCGVGKDLNGKCIIFIWDVKESKIGKIKCEIRTHTDVDISAIKLISNHTSTIRFASCGKQNIRIWRVKDSSLRSAPIVLPLNDLELTDIAVNCDKTRVFSCASSGHIFEIDCERMAIIQARRLVSSSGNGLELNSISLSESMCATASSDGLLRQWPHDFSKVLLEADLEYSVVIARFSPDCLRVAAATNSCSLGYLDIANRSFTTVCRSHSTDISDIAIAGRQIVSVGCDKTIRIWNGCQQLYDFSSPKDAPLKIAASRQRPLLVVGFKSGAIRILDIPNTCILFENKSHEKAITSVAFGLLHVYSTDLNGCINLFEIENLRMIRQLPYFVKQSESIKMSLSYDMTKLAVPSITKGILNVLDSSSLDELIRCDIGDDISSVDFHPSLSFIIVASGTNIFRICSQTGSILTTLEDAHRRFVTSVCSFLPNHVLSGGQDDVVKVWSSDKVWKRKEAKFQVFIGHGSKINNIFSTSDQLSVISSTSSAIFFWDFLGSSSPVDIKRENERFISSTNTIRNTVEDVNFDDIEKLSDIAKSPDAEIIGHDIEYDEGEDLICTIKSFNNDENKSLVQPIVNSDTQIEKFPSNFENDLTSNRQYVHPFIKSHFKRRDTRSSLAVRRYLPTEGSAGIKLHSVVGFDGSGRKNLVWLPNSGLMAYSNGCILVIDELGKDQQHFLTGHNQQISTLALANDNTQIASSSSGTIIIWNIETITKHKELKDAHKSEIIAMQFSPDDQFLATLGNYEDRKINIFKTDHYEIVSFVQSNFILHDIAWSPLKIMEIVTPAENGIICLWTLKGDQLHCLEKKSPPEMANTHLTCIIFSGEYFFVGNSNGTISAWNSKQETCSLHWLAYDKIEILCLASCLQSPFKIISGANTIRLWSTEDALSPKGNASVTLISEISLDGSISSMFWNENMNMGLVGTNTNTLWYVNWIDHSKVRLASAHPKPITDIVCQNNCIASSSQDGSVRVWTGKELTFQFDIKSKNVGATKLSWKENFLVVGYDDGNLRLFDVLLVKLISKLSPHSTSITALAIMNTVVLSGSLDGIIAASSLNTSLIIRVIKAHIGSSINSISVFGNRWLAGSQDSRISVWKADWTQDKCDIEDWISLPKTASVVDRHNKYKPTLACFSHDEPDCIVIYSLLNSPNDLSIYNLTVQRVVRTIPIVHDVRCLDIGGSLLALGSTDRLLTILDYYEGSFQDFSIFDDTLNVVKFNIDSQKLIAASHCFFTIWNVVHD